MRPSGQITPHMFVYISFIIIYPPEISISWDNSPTWRIIPLMKVVDNPGDQRPGDWTWPLGLFQSISTAFLGCRGTNAAVGVHPR